MKEGECFMKRILAILMAFVMIFSITGCKNKTKTKTNESKPKTTQTTVKKTEEKAKTEKEDASDKEDTEDTEQTDDEDQKSDDGETKQEAKQTSNTGTSGNGSTGNSGGNQSGGSNSDSGNTASTTKKQEYSGKDSHGHEWCPHGTCPEQCRQCNPPTPSRDYNYAATFLSLLNSYRASLGLGTLQMEGFMQEFAMQRANDLTYDYSHTNHGHNSLAGCPVITVTEELPEYDEYGCPTGKTITDVSQMYKYVCAGECIYRNPDMTPAEALAGFKASSGHNAILTYAQATHVGIGVVVYDGVVHYAVETYTSNG